MLKQKTKLYSLIISSIIISIFLGINITNAAYNPVSRNICTLMVKPYNSTASPTYGSAGDNFIKYLSSQVCKNHLNYPSAYSPQPPLNNQENQVKSGAENKKLPITRHDHLYYNDSVQDANYYYKAFVDKFEITIESDGRNNLITNEIWCDTPVPSWYNGSQVNNLSDCSGTASDLYGGTTVTKQVTGNSIKITWDFANISQDGKYLSRPIVWGNNGSNFQVHDKNNNLITLNLTDENYRNLPFHVHLTTKDNDNIWSATTTSRVLLADLAIKKSNYQSHGGDGCSNNDVNSPNSGWCYLPPVSGYQTQSVYTSANRTFYWFPIGSVATIWQKIPDIPPPSNYCDDLDIVAPSNLEYIGGNTYRYPADTEATFEVEPHFANNNEKPALDYRWNAKKWSTNLNLGPSDRFGTDGGATLQDNFDLEFITKPPVIPQPGDVMDIGSFTLNNLLAALPGPGVSPTSTQPSGSQLIFGQQYGLFYDAKNVGSGKNPYVDEGNSWPMGDDKSTYYNGGPGSTLIHVEAVPADAPNKYTAPAVGNGCEADIIIYSPPEDNSCIDLDIYQNDQNGNPAEVPATLPIDSNTDHFYVQVSTDPEDWDLDFTWNIITTESETISTSETDNPSEFVDINGTITNGTVLEVEAFDPKDENKTPINNCNDTLTFTEDVICEILTITSSAGDPLDQGKPTILTASAQFTDGTPITEVTYSDSDGSGDFSSPYTFNCSMYGRNNPLTLPASCTVMYTGGNAGEQITVVVPGYEDICIQTINIIPVTPPACRKLDLDPNELEADGTTNLTATVEFNQTGDYNTTITWDSDETGEFNGNQDGYTQNQESTSVVEQIFKTSFTANDPNNQSVEVYVSDIAGGVTILPECAAHRKIAGPPEECEEIEVECNEESSGFECCITVTEGEYTGNYTWEIDGIVDLGETGECANIPAESSLEVYADDFPNACRYEYDTPTPPPPPPEGPSLEKRIKTTQYGGYTTNVVTVQYDHKQLFYELTFTPKSPNTSATITDTISDGDIIADLLPPNEPGSPDPGRISYAINSMKVKDSSGNEISHCSDLPEPEEDDILTNCYTGDIGNPSGVELVNVDKEIYITYQADVFSSLTPEVCKEGIVCEEIYRNRAKADDVQVYDEDNDSYTRVEPIFTDWREVQIFCQYILTRAAGDVFLETALTRGIDIYECSEYKSTTGIIVTPGEEKEPDLAKTGTGDTAMFTVGHEVCSQGQAGEFIDSELADLYGSQIFGNLSSQICEVRLRTGSPWKQEIITNSIDENKTRISRWFPDSTTNTNISILKNSDQAVFRIKDANLTIDTPYKLSDGEGAKTYIIENGDLIINNDITYGTCNKPDGNCSVREVASLAFIVLNGNIYIDNDVKTISGVFFVQEGKTEGTGRLYSHDSNTKNFDEAQSDKPLNVFGSIYGDIDPLFSQRFFAGDPSSDEGGIVIRFDQRIILNTPPGLRDILSLSQLEVAR